MSDRVGWTRFRLIVIGQPRGLATHPEYFLVRHSVCMQCAAREVVAFGAELYADYCGSCHGKGAVARFGGSVPDLRYADADTHGIWNGIVIGGALHANGMPSFELDPREADAIRLFVLAKARELAASIER